MIVTSQPDVACDVCGRRLLRGEQPDVFLAGGRRRTVCELCAPRASAEGWLRETDHRSVSLPPARPRRGRNLLGRLRQPREPAQPAGEDALMAVPQESSRASYDFLDGTPAAGDASLDVVPEVAESSAQLIPGVHDSVLPAPAAPLADADTEPAGDDLTTDTPDPSEEDGSWRDAWMFVKE